MQQASGQTYETANRSEQVSERRCVVRGESGSTDLLIRFAIAPDNTIVPDLAEKLPGRGIWVTADASCIEQAVAKKLFSRSAKQPVTTPPNLLETTRTLLAARVGNQLGLAKKSGALAVGADVVQAELKSQSLCAVICAADASASGVADMRQRASIPVIQTTLTAAQIGAAMGRDNTVYMGLPRNKQGFSLMRDFLRLNGLYISLKEAA